MRHLALALLAASSGVLLGAVVFEGGASRAVYPRQTIPIAFDHAYHVRPSDDAKGIKGEGLSCTFCHENIEDQRDPAETDIPGHGACDSCHGDWIGSETEPAPSSECRRCHVDLREGTWTATRAARMKIPPPNLRFTHAEHAAHKLECDACHGNVATRALATRDDYPLMDRCIQCHKEQGASIECKTCHLTGATGRLLTDFPDGKLVPSRYHQQAVHTGDFLRDHSVPAQRQPEYCKKCHGPEDCVECHDGVNRDTRYHAADFLAVHGIKARVDDVRCASCHRAQSFCLDCHARSGVASIVRVNDPSTFTLKTVRDRATPDRFGPHPMAAEGWLNPSSKNFHGFHAARNIGSCASCHQEQYCVRCHGSRFDGRTTLGQPGGNPHGPNPERLKGSAVRKNAARACLKCHSPFDSSWR